MILKSPDVERLRGPHQEAMTQMAGWDIQVLLLEQEYCNLELYGAQFNILSSECSYPHMLVGTHDPSETETKLEEAVKQAEAWQKEAASISEEAVKILRRYERGRNPALRLPHRRICNYDGDLSDETPIVHDVDASDHSALTSDGDSDDPPPVLEVHERVHPIHLDNFIPLIAEATPEPSITSLL